MGNAIGPRKKLPKEDMQFLMTNTNFTKKQIKQWYLRIYSRLSPSGQLSKKKFIEVYSGFFPDGNAEEFCTHVFRTFDKDNSACWARTSPTSTYTPEARTEEIFDKMDLNKDGVLCRDEFMKGCLADKQLYSMLLADEPAESEFAHSVKSGDTQQFPISLPPPTKWPNLYSIWKLM
uniref:EF-hand domain-containing protein n=1 Tax=Macrostomum lignano TaxID=282301 RepID=A0A1I8JM02_9PLAT